MITLNKKMEIGNPLTKWKGDFTMPSEKKKDELNEKLKYEIAEELGLLDKVLEGGWRSLTSKETGRIGGLITKKRRELKNTEEQRDS